ncbi:MAG TPA: hypothetical protein VGD63_17260 [Steroidobacteraceae bacterium]
MIVRPAAAGPWNIEPRLGASVDYETNPALHEFDTRAEEHVAALIYLPLRYDADAVEFSLIPNARFSNSQGYSTLASNFVHIDSSAVFVNERGSTTLQAGLARDSSLYYLGATLNGAGVRRDTATTAIDWTHFFTERAQVQLDGSWAQVRYAQPANDNFLTDYRYPNAGPTFSYAVDERDTLKVIGNAGFYQSLDGRTSSKSQTVQLAFVRQLSELWTLSSAAGYSKSANIEKIFYGPILLGDINSTQNSTVYSANLNRQGETFGLNAGFARALQPTGFSYLSRQDSVTLNGTYTRSERWDFSLSAAWQKTRNPLVSAGVAQLGGGGVTVRYLNAQATANWHWTELWVVSLHATRIMEQYGPPAASGASSGVSLDLTRQFLRTEL